MGIDWLPAFKLDVDGGNVFDYYILYIYKKLVPGIILMRPIRLARASEHPNRAPKPAIGFSQHRLLSGAVFSCPGACGIPNARYAAYLFKRTPCNWPQHEDARD